MKIPSKISLVSVSMVIMSLAACSGLTSSDAPANRTWWLEPYTGSTLSLTAESVPLVEVSVSAVPGLDTNRILTLSDDAELNRYAAARWAENLPELVESLVGRTLESSGRFEVVTERGRAGLEDCELQLEVREFFAHLDSGGGTSGVRVAVSGRYQCGAAEAVPLRLSAAVPVGGERMTVIVGAFQEAFDSVMEDLLKSI
jgi:cholesterol transport system auxiliary component